MTISDTTTVGEIAAALPSSVRVFQRYGIDFCCGGKTPLSTACRNKGLSLSEVIGAIGALAAGPRAEGRDWGDETLTALTDHVVAAYHEPLREELPRLEAMAAKVAAVHGASAPYLSRLHSIVMALSADLQSHMQKEERVLFPAIRALEQGDGPVRPLSTPIAVMEHEHDDAGALLAELDAMTNHYAPPEWACGTFRALYHGLAELESTMHMHVHLENNILFPRALESAGGR